MGRPASYSVHALKFLRHEWEADEGLRGELREYLVGMVRELTDELDGAGPLDLMLAADFLRAHRASVETSPDAMTRARLLSAQERVRSKLTGWSRVRTRRAATGATSGGRSSPLWAKQEPPLADAPARRTDEEQEAS
jgi:hypothetical protein